MQTNLAICLAHYKWFSQRYLYTRYYYPSPQMSSWLAPSPLLGLCTKALYQGGLFDCLYCNCKMPLLPALLSRTFHFFSPPTVSSSFNSTYHLLITNYAIYTFIMCI